MGKWQWGIVRGQKKCPSALGLHFSSLQKFLNVQALSPTELLTQTDRQVNFSYRWSSTILSAPQIYMQGFPGRASGEEPACQYRRHETGRCDPWVGKIPWRRAWQSTPIFATEMRRRVGYGPSDSKELDMTEATQHSIAQHTAQLSPNTIFLSLFPNGLLSLALPSYIPLLTLSPGQIHPDSFECPLTTAIATFLSDVTRSLKFAQSYGHVHCWTCQTLKKDKLDGMNSVMGSIT